MIKYVGLIFIGVMVVVVTIVLVMMNNAKIAAEKAAIDNATSSQRTLSEQLSDYWNSLTADSECRQYQYVPDNLKPSKCRGKSDVSINSNMILGMFA